MKALLLLAVCLLGNYAAGQFLVDYENDRFIMNGQPFKYISGSIHYFRTPRQYWRDRMRKMAAVGVNTVSTYVEWSQHEREPGQYDFSGDLNITEFVRTAQEEGLYTILRVGPFINSEREMGGFPYWLLREYPDIRLRVNDPRYTQYLEKWLDVLLPYVDPLLFGNGGPIITVQVENEYGFSGQCDHDYTSWLAGVFQRHIGDKAVLFTNDGSDFNSLSCGKIPGVYATLDFGPFANVTEMYISLKKVEPHGPFVDSEFYTGWLTHWGENWARRDNDQVLTTLRDILNFDTNFNFYTFCGGTNFGFSAGGSFGSNYNSVITSYDFDAPVTEAGDITPKYLAIRDVLQDYLKINTTLPVNSTKGDYGTLNLQLVARMTGQKSRQVLGRDPVISTYPRTFESISQDQGYVLYEALSPVEGSNLDLTLDARDIAHVYVNNEIAGVLSREFQTTTLPITVAKNDQISIFVENSGRVCFGDRINDSKGILSNVTLGGTPVLDWTITGYDLNKLDELVDACTLGPAPEDCTDGPGFRIFSGSFLANVTSNIEYEGEKLVADTFLDVSGLKKGVVFVNGKNLGRYWSTRGPQYYLYVPGAWLYRDPMINSVVLIEEEDDSNSLTVPFSTTPIIGDPK